MKKALSFVFIITLFNLSDGIQAKISKQNLMPSCVVAAWKTCDKYYFLTKEITRYFIILCCFADVKKVRNVGIACAQCDYKLLCTDIWPWLILKLNKPMVHKMQWMMRHASAEQLAEFFLQAQAEEHIWCPNCLKDEGWYKIL